MGRNDKFNMEDWRKHQEWEKELERSETEALLRECRIRREYGEYIETPLGKMHSSILLPKAGGNDRLRPSKYFKKQKNEESEK